SWSFGPGYWGGCNRPSYWASYRPGGNRPTGPRPGWSNASSHRYNPTAGRTPGYTNRTPGHSGGYYGNNSNYKPGNSGNHTVAGNIGTNGNTGYGRQPGQGAYQSSRPGNNSGSVSSNKQNNPRPTGYNGNNIGSKPGSSNGTAINNVTRPSGSGNSGVPSGPGRQSNSGAYNSNRNSSNSNRSYTAPSYNSNSNSNRSYNSNSNSNRSYNSGGMGGSHRSTGGGMRSGGSRGGRR
ncbi:MAG: hypothetical protein K2J15_03330, partial [Muribaculaceae bacterium]|nr:hypothetical protein [Muribaculaceae bacterium]